jgi:hypothetical protein
MKKLTMSVIIMFMVMLFTTACASNANSNPDTNDRIEDLIPGYIINIQEIPNLSYREAVDSFKEKAVEGGHYNDTSAEYAGIQKAKASEGVTENLEFLIKGNEVEEKNYKQPTSQGHYNGYNVCYKDGQVTLWIHEKEIPMGALDEKAYLLTSYKSSDNNQYIRNGSKIYLIDDAKQSIILLADDFAESPITVDDKFYYISVNHELKKGDEVLLENIYGASDNQCNTIYLTLYR